MHFLVFVYLSTMIAISFGGLLYIMVSFLQDISDKRWGWVGIHLITGPLVIFILHYFVDLMCKFSNA